MKNECQTLLTEAHAILAEAKSLNETSQQGAAMKQAYHASDIIAAAYMSTVIGHRLLPNDAAYGLFAKTIREPNRHPALLQAIKEVVGDVCALREVYEPALLDETTQKDAQQMTNHVTELLELVKKVASDSHETHFMALV